MYKKIFKILIIICTFQYIEIKSKYDNFINEPEKQDNLNNCHKKVAQLKKTNETKSNKKARKKEAQEKRDARIKKRTELDSEKQGIIKALRKDDIKELEKYSHYDWNTLRSGEWGFEQTNGLIDCIYYNSVNCLRYLLKNNKFSKKGLTTLSSNNFYPLDYALQPVQDEMLDMLLDKFKKLKLNPTEFITPRYKNEYKLYLTRKLKFYENLQSELS